MLGIQVNMQAFFEGHEGGKAVPGSDFIHAQLPRFMDDDKSVTHMLLNPARPIKLQCDQSKIITA